VGVNFHVVVLVVRKEKEMESKYVLGMNGFVETLVTVSPVLISVPHAGMVGKEFSVFKKRAKGKRARDRYIWSVAMEIAPHTAVNVARMLLPRRVIDVNRSREGEDLYPLAGREVHAAFDDPKLEPVYQAYHETLDTILIESVKRFEAERVLLMDLHGFNNQPDYAPEGGYDLILGTANRTTIHHGEVDRVFHRFMEDRGYRVFLPGVAPVRPTGDWFSGQYTVRYHAERHKINTLQVEISDRLRSSRDLRAELGIHIAEFVNEVFWF
jgi:N-formylglutamate amidohydrolase